MRLYKESPAEPPPSPSPPKPTRGAKDSAGVKGKGPKGKGKRAKKQGGLGGGLMAAPAEPSWELLASSTAELQAVAEDLTGQKANAEADIGYQVRSAGQCLQHTASMLALDLAHHPLLQGNGSVGCQNAANVSFVLLPAVTLDLFLLRLL